MNIKDKAILFNLDVLDNKGNPTGEKELINLNLSDITDIIQDARRLTVTYYSPEVEWAGVSSDLIGKLDETLCSHGVIDHNAKLPQP